eukprot:3506385-Prymnesium_polylepis.1
MARLEPEVNRPPTNRAPGRAAWLPPGVRSSGDKARAAVGARAEEEEAEDGQVGEVRVARVGEAEVGAATRV